MRFVSNCRRLVSSFLERERGGVWLSACVRQVQKENKRGRESERDGEADNFFLYNLTFS